MEIVVCIKQVPDPGHIQLDPKTGTIIRGGVPAIINTVDKNALEAALQLRKINGGRVTVVSMGPPSTVEALQEALALGADRAALASDRAFAGADTLATSVTLAALINKTGPFDLVLCGYSSLDGGTAQVGPQTAAILEVPFFTAVQKMEKSAAGIQVEMETEEGVVAAESSLPALATITKGMNRPRGIRLSEAKKAKNKELFTYDLQGLGLSDDQVGEKGSGVCMVEVLPLPAGRDAEIISGEPEEIAGKIQGEIMKLGLQSRGGNK